MTVDPSSDEIFKQLIHDLQDRKGDGRSYYRTSALAVTIVDAQVNGVCQHSLHLAAEGGTEKARKLVNDRLYDVFRSSELDHDRVRNINLIIGDLLRMTAISGTAFLLRVFDSKSPLKFYMRLLGIDQLASNLSQQLSNGGRIVQGIEYDAQDRPVAIHFIEGQKEGFLTQSKTRRVEWQDLAVMSVPRGLEAGQILGDSWLTPAMELIDKIEYFIIATIQRQNSAASFAVVIEPPERFNRHFAAPGEDSDAKEDGENSHRVFKRNSFREEYVQQFMELKPNTFRISQQGEKINFTSPPDVIPVKDFLNPILQMIARASGLSYEAVSGDYSNSSYSAARMADNQTRQWIKHRQAVLESRVLSKISAWIEKGLKLEGIDLKDIWLRWQYPSPLSSNPKEEAETNELYVKNMAKSLSQWMRDLGQDPEVVFNELERENELLKKIAPLRTKDLKSGLSMSYDVIDKRLEH